MFEIKEKKRGGIADFKKSCFYFPTYFCPVQLCFFTEKGAEIRRKDFCPFGTKKENANDFRLKKGRMA